MSKNAPHYSFHCLTPFPPKRPVDVDDPPGGPPGRPLNSLDRDYSHWQVLSLVCTLKYHVILLLLSHRSWGACKDGGHRKRVSFRGGRGKPRPSPSHFLREKACGRYFVSSPRIAIRTCLVHRAKCRVRLAWPAHIKSAVWCRLWGRDRTPPEKIG